MSKKISKEVPTKSGEVVGLPDDEEETEEDEDLEISKLMQKFTELQLDLSLLNHEITSPSEVKEIKTLTPLKCDLKKYVAPVIPQSISVMSWNIDFHLTHMGKRTVAIVDLIEKEDHDIILLQEVTTVNFNYILSRLKDKYAIVRQENNTYYYTATLLKKQTIGYESHKMIYFRNTGQGRSILFTKVSVGGAKLDIMNVHLESLGGKEMSKTRVAQLKKCVAIASATSSDSNVLIGGDFNIREYEVKQAPLPKTASDLWVRLGTQKATQYTWDMTVNKNLAFEVPVPPKRFDRFLFKSTIPETLKPYDFALTGKERLLGVEEEHYLSDHWAIVAKFRLHPSIQCFAAAPTTEKASSVSVNADKREEEDRADDHVSKEQKNEEFVKENWYDED